MTTNRMSDEEWDRLIARWHEIDAQMARTDEEPWTPTRDDMDPSGRTAGIAILAILLAFVVGAVLYVWIAR